MGIFHFTFLFLLVLTTILTVNIVEGKTKPIYNSFYAYCVTPFLHISPHNDIAREHSFVSELGEERLNAIVNSQASLNEVSNLVTKGFSSSPDCLQNGRECPSFLNPILVKNLMVSHSSLDFVRIAAHSFV